MAPGPLILPKPPINLSAGETAQITVSYGVTDTNNAISEGSFTINITGTNDKPVANAAALVLSSIQEDTTLNVSESQLLSGISDVDGDNLSIVADSITITTGDAQVTGDASTGWTITPDANYNGEVSFSYSISDGTTGDEVSSTATFQVLNLSTTRQTPSSLQATAEDAAKINGQLTQPMPMETTSPTSLGAPTIA